jgi:hypothetical protein
MVHTRYDNQRASFIHSFIHRSAPQWWESMRLCPIGYDGNVLSFPTWRNGPFQEITDIPPPPLAPGGGFFFPVGVLLRWPADHIGPEWFSTRWRTIHPLDAWTPVSIGSHWAKVIQHPPTHHPSTRCLNLLWMNLNLSRAQPARAGPLSLTDWLTDRLAELIY